MNYNQVAKDIAADADKIAERLGITKQEVIDSIPEYIAEAQIKDAIMWRMPLDEAMKLLMAAVSTASLNSKITKQILKVSRDSDKKIVEVFKKEALRKYQEVHQADDSEQIKQLFIISGCRQDVSMRLTEVMVQKNIIKGF